MAKPLELVNVEDLTICDSTAQMITKAREDGVELFFDRANAMKACPIGEKSACCKHCSMGPCRMNVNSPYDRVGVCGATVDTILARNFGRMVAAGTAAHTDHGMAMLELFRDVINGKVKDFAIKDPMKLYEVATSLEIPTEGRELKEVAMDLYHELERTYTQVDGEIPMVKRVPKKTLELWRQAGIVPRGAMREIMEMMHRTAIGVDQDYKNITQQISRTALADGWGGSMVSTDISDILFGTPSPVEIEVDMGVLKEDRVNIIVHGHEPILLEAMMISAADPALKQMAVDAGAKGINLVGMCCSGLDVMSRHGLPHAGNFSSTEAVLVTGAVDAMTVDIQCIKQDLKRVADFYDTPFITTNYRAKIEGALHIQLDEHDPLGCTEEIIIKAISRFKTRKKPVRIPRKTVKGVHGFSYEYINYMLGGSFRGSFTPLNDNIINGRIRGVAGVVGCTNPRSKQDYSHVELVKELIRNDVLVLQTGCSQMALAKAGLTGPGAAALAGPGLAEVCETVGMPPILGLGACVDNSRILIAASEMVRVGGLGDCLADLPAAGCAPEWMSEKAIAIGHYFVASGVYVVFGHTFPMTKGTQFEKYLFEGLENEGFGKWAFSDDPKEMARLMIAHIDEKRAALGIDKARERVLLDMADRRSLDANA
ncbi:anaerobic carbon-monoxide dehydrogenase catalytic subunit [Desulforhopalus singaporensis]|uniref:Carbon monoxide dehydrogenase n=1 Tax=Desulforhopalus singaporensis TaxID=91360 RepID=A0A1H0TNJ7_9BACT|nr:anaerobic carbon-monoxide dehydrogenase catalytic subunit [Desulforhopalus singaporensis]SDP55335.1 carbon-monoxide dehydrogenase catalytic subunit [Desulforhopalus singaporensis]